MPLKHIIKNRRLLRRLLIAILVIAAVAIYVHVSVIRNNRRAAVPVAWGVTFSVKYAKELGLDWKEAYLSVLDDLGARRLRIPIYWDEVQPASGPYDFRDYDWMMAEAAKRQAKVLLVVGRRVPRWPECHTPKWIAGQGLAKENEMLLDLVRTEVKHFKDAPALDAWQLENEPLLDLFGRCPPGDTALLGLESKALKAIDSAHPIVITDSGELSFWVRTGAYADILGISMYRVSWNKWLGYFYYPISPGFYADKAAAVSPLVKKIIVTELQAEPWPSNERSIPDTPIDEQYRSMSIQRFRDNVDFVRRVGLPEVYLWGVEWWYWIKERGNADFWNEAKNLFARPAAN